MTDSDQQWRNSKAFEAMLNAVPPGTPVKLGGDFSFPPQAVQFGQSYYGVECKNGDSFVPFFRNPYPAVDALTLVPGEEGRSFIAECRKCGAINKARAGDLRSRQL